MSEVENNPNALSEARETVLHLREQLARVTRQLDVETRAKQKAEGDALHLFCENRRLRGVSAPSIQATAASVPYALRNEHAV